MEVYTIYHIPGIKVGVTRRDPNVRVKEQGYSDFEVLEQHYDIKDASWRESELQKEYGYQVDIINYNHTTTVAFKASLSAESRRKRIESHKGKKRPKTAKRMKGLKLRYGKGTLYKDMISGFTGYYTDIIKEFKTGGNIHYYLKKNRPIKRRDGSMIHLVVIEPTSLPL